VIDEFEKFCSTDRNHFDLTSIIEKFAKGDLLQIIGITTPFKYEKYIYNNTKIRNTFARVDVSEITKDKALYILMEKAIDFEIRFNLIIPYETIVQIIDKSNFFITSIPFPEKALQLLDDVCIYTSQKLKQNTVLPEVVGTVITSKTHIPTTLDIEMKEKLLNLENLMNERIVGQYEAIAELASALRRSFLLIGKRKKPIASFLFLGPTGVGKTETAKVLSEVFFGSSEKLIRFDMSLYQNKSDVDKLIGSIEQLNPGLLTNSIRENPYGVLLLDEIEKAHPDLLNIFLTITDEGYFTDGYGQNVDCKNMVIVATSNAGSSYMDEILIKQSLNKASLNSLNSSSIIDYLVEKRAFSPEFLNRFDSVVAYKPLQKEKAEDLAKLMIASLSDTIFQMYKVKINVSENTLKQLTNQGYDVQYGARNLQRILRQKVEDTIAKLLLEGKAKEGDTISL
jgi:ATP-dependent Clp protease ATP-binding subunit ClpA